MEKSSFRKVQALRKLPPGFRFQPSDEEAVFQYLVPKVFSWPLPASIIPEISTSRYDPCKAFPGDSADKDKYFFSSRELGYQTSNGGQAAEDGHWKSCGSEKRIVCWKWKPIIGLKKKLVFHKGKHPQASKTDWIMHEYYITISRTPACDDSKKRKNSQDCSIQIGQWVLCHVFKKKPGTKAETYVNRQRIYDFTKAEMEDTDSSSSLGSDSAVSSEVSCSLTYEEMGSQKQKIVV